MQQRTLAEWLDYQQRIHPRSVELGLERVGTVWERMGAPRPAPVVITVGGTNGKGSTIAFLEAMLAASGKRTGAYTSPHLLRYNERVRVGGAQVADEELVEAFERIEVARAEIALTYFEFGTLAALWIFSRARLDAALLEVGLGGRLDAVNIIDADATVVTSVDLDHMEWLGNDRESIGREKAGIFRGRVPAVVGTCTPPDSILAEARRVGAALILAGRDYRAETGETMWQWRNSDCTLRLPMPGLRGPCQIDNAAAAIAVLFALRRRLGWDSQAVAAGVRDAHLPARIQRFAGPGAAELVVDVAHNPQAAAMLARWLAENPPGGRNLAVYGALADKDVEAVAAGTAPWMDRWFGAGLEKDSPRGLPARDLVTRIRQALPDVRADGYATVDQALDAAFALSRPDDRVIAFGSFFVAAATLNWAQRHAQCRAAGQTGAYNRHTDTNSACGD